MVRRRPRDKWSRKSANSRSMTIQTLVNCGVYPLHQSSSPTGIDELNSLTGGMRRKPETNRPNNRRRKRAFGFREAGLPIQNFKLSIRRHHPLAIAVNRVIWSRRLSSASCCRIYALSEQRRGGSAPESRIPTTYGHPTQIDRECYPYR